MCYVCVLLCKCCQCSNASAVQRRVTVASTFVQSLLKPNEDQMRIISQVDQKMYIRPNICYMFGNHRTQQIWNIWQKYISSNPFPGPSVKSALRLPSRRKMKSPPFSREKGRMFLVIHLSRKKGGKYPWERSQKKSCFWGREHFFLLPFFVGGGLLRAISVRVKNCNFKMTKTQWKICLPRKKTKQILKLKNARIHCFCVRLPDYISCQVIESKLHQTQLVTDDINSCPRKKRPNFRKG